MVEGPEDKRQSLREALRDLPAADFRATLRRRLATMLPPAPVTRVDVRRIGIVSDTHCRRDDGSDLPDGVLGAFRGVDLILHCGDLTTTAVLDRLQTVAPVLAVRGDNDDRSPDPRLSDGARVVQLGEYRIGVCFDLGSRLKQQRLFYSREDISEFAVARFGADVDLIAFGATHRSLLKQVGGKTLLNAGSPTLPADGRAGVAIVELTPEGLRAQLVPLRVPLRKEGKT